MNITKDEALRKILGIMDEQGEISVSDISSALRARQHPKPEENFDLLIESFGKLKRVPFETGKNMAPLGIFPRNGLKFYIELDETPMVPFPELKTKSELIDEEMATLIMEVRNELNDKLRELGKPILSGDYWMDGHELSGIGYWMAKYRDGKLKVDYYDASRRAKIRKFGRLTA
jgi:hypothetical protein